MAVQHLKCFICGMTSSGMDELREHLAVRHAEYSRHVCSACPNFNAYRDEAVAEHGRRFRTHRITFNETHDEYKEQLVEALLADCIEAMTGSGTPSAGRPLRHEERTGSVANEPAISGYELKEEPGEETGAAVDNCGQCGMEVRADYTAHRTHVLEQHPPGVGTIAHLGDEQIYLRTGIAACFPASRIRSDMTCQHEGCGTELDIEQNMRAAQRKHIEEMHAPVELQCPCCAKSIKHLAALSAHLFSHHKGVNCPTDEQKAAIDSLRAEVNKTSRELLPQCFPFGDPSSDRLLCETIRKVLVEEGRLDPEPHVALSRIGSASLERFEMRRQQAVARRRGV